TPNLDWLLLTKRPENIRRMIPNVADRRDFIKDGKTNVESWYRPNVRLGCSIATQRDADENIPELLKCRDLSPCLFVSAEPLVEKVAFSAIPFVHRELDGPPNPSILANDWTTLYGNALTGFRATSMQSGTD